MYTKLLKSSAVAALITISAAPCRAEVITYDCKTCDAGHCTVTVDTTARSVTYRGADDNYTLPAQSSAGQIVWGLGEPAANEHPVRIDRGSGQVSYLPWGATHWLSASWGVSHQRDDARALGDETIELGAERAARFLLESIGRAGNRRRSRAHAPCP
jgi:hypothetical protein